MSPWFARRTRRQLQQHQQPIGTKTEPIEMELHLLGGFLDEAGASQELSTSLVTTFSSLAHKYRHVLRISLSTAAISCLNSEEQQSSSTNDVCDIKHQPKSRGLGIETRTGKVFPVKAALPSHWEGPAVEIRAARTWSKSRECLLSVIHDTRSGGQVRIEPFTYEPLRKLDVLLQVPDHILLKVTSSEFAKLNCAPVRFDSRCAAPS
jgi:hypothetical protein